MANEEHLQLIEQGVDAWNTWRRQNPNVEPDLSGADLSGVDLSRTNLSDADLSNADLSDANLSGANLDGVRLREADLCRANLAAADVRVSDLRNADFSSANLRRADLHAAKLDNANLSDADLSEANLFGAKLSNAVLLRSELTDANFFAANLSGAVLAYANLSRTNLSNAGLSGADLTEAIVSDTIFANVNLTETTGLDTCEHEGPSIIDPRTLLWSAGQLPLSFLRGCGLSDWEIEGAKLYRQALGQDQISDLAYEIARLRGEQPIQFYSCFISYSSQDREFAQRFHADLQENGIRCWFAPEDMKIGDRIRTRIDEVICLHEKLLLVLSANSINSDWVEKEVETAFEKERESKSIVLFPIRLDDAVMTSKSGWAADIRRSRHIGDFGHWKDHDGYRKALDRLLRDLKVEPET